MEVSRDSRPSSNTVKCTSHSVVTCRVWLDKQSVWPVKTHQWLLPLFHSFLCSFPRLESLSFLFWYDFSLVILPFSFVNCNRWLGSTFNRSHGVQPGRNDHTWYLATFGSGIRSFTFQFRWSACIWSWNLRCFKGLLFCNPFT